MLGELLRNGVLAGAVSIAPYGDFAKNPFQTDLPPQSPEATIIETGEDPILAEAKRLGINESSTEKELWNSTPTPIETSNLSFDQLARKADRKFLRDLRKMDISENPVFNESIDVYFTDINGFSTYSIDDPEFSGILTQVGIDENAEVFVDFVYNPRDLLTRDSLELAYFIVQDATTTKHFADKLSSMPEGLSIEEMAARSVADSEETLLINAKAIARQAEATIWQTGLMGDSQISPEVIEIVDFYIQIGKNPESQEWIDYVAEKSEMFEALPYAQPTAV